MKERGGEVKVNHALLKETIIKNIDYLKSKAYLQEKEVYDLVKTFFKEYLGLYYEFTHDELTIELQNIFYDKKLEDSVLNFLRKTAKIEYSDDELEAAELKSILIEFRSIVEDLIKAKKKDKGFLSNLIFWKSTKNEDIPVEKEEKEEIVDAIEDLEIDQKKETKPNLFSKEERVIEHKTFNEEEVKDVPKRKLSVIEALKSDLSGNKSGVTKSTSETVEDEKTSLPEEKKDDEVADLEIPTPEVFEDKNKEKEDKKQQKEEDKRKNQEEKKKKVSEKKVLEEKKKQERELNKDKKEEKTNSKEKNKDSNEEENKEETLDIQKLLNKFNFEKDKKAAYLKIREVYDKLPTSEQHKYYDKVMKLYDRVK